ncbi:winged helix-turn-helix transcriptional regulator [Azospirillum thermophilum]|uniref:ArsR family transcriptional regulator n=1 Tax=Azospirillum thermophilum TaxID=2202148 RepID=A0A2S2D089_9PROT|nr:winged helix-turn-helix transcriptional regulator [Azospirillum thermophilum]AWK90070.1 ArsR family transcriptional regulator [Azospirillum thermophilum]
MDRALDSTDLKILRELQEDGRISNVELARRINLSPAACLERVKRLQNDGIIQRYVALLDPQRLGAGMMVFIQVVLDRTTPENFDAFKGTVQRMPQVMECHMVAGGFDYLVKARVRDMNEYRLFLGEFLATTRGVRETHTYAVMEEVKNVTAIPLDQIAR